MRRQRSTHRLCGKLFRNWPQVFGLLGKTRLEVLQGELHLRDLGIELLGGAPILHALQAGDLKAQLLEFEFLRDEARFGGFERRAVLAHQVLQRFDVVRQICRFGHATKVGFSHR